MKSVSNAWLWVKCFVLGFDYTLMKESTVDSKNMLKKYFSGIIVISILWGCIGYQLALSYFKNISPYILSSVLVLIIVMIERQIILSTTKNWWQKGIRFFLGIVMAFLGATIIDSIIFEGDIEREKAERNIVRINSLYNKRSEEINLRIVEAQNEIDSLNLKMSKNNIEIIKNPKIKTWSYKTRRTPQLDSLGRQLKDEQGNKQYNIERESEQTLSDNILIETNEFIKQNIEQRQGQLNSYTLQKDSLKIKITNEVNNEKGIIDNLILLSDVVSKEWESIAFYWATFMFFLFIEILVLLAKIDDEGIRHDYKGKLEFQEEIAKEKREALKKNLVNK